MKVELTTLEATYLSNMLASIIVSVKGFDKKARKQVEKIRDHILPPRVAARLSQGDLKMLLNFVNSGITVCAETAKTETDENKLTNTRQISELLKTVKTKLEGGLDS